MKSQLSIDRIKASPQWNSIVKKMLYQSVFHGQKDTWQLDSVYEGITCSQGCLDSAMELPCGSPVAAIRGQMGRLTLKACSWTPGCDVSICASPNYHPVKLFQSALFKWASYQWASFKTCTHLWGLPEASVAGWKWRKQMAVKGFTKHKMDV